MSAADTACYVAKDAGRNRVHIYHRDDDAATRHSGEMHWVHRIRRALEENRLVLYHQPVAALQGRVYNVHSEILVRMEGEEQEQRGTPALERALATAREEAAARAAALEAERAGAQARLDGLEARREANVRELPAAVRARYERVHASRDGRAVVPIEKSACGGCFRTLPPAVLQEARRRDHALSCDGCGRLMVWPPGAA